MTGAVSIVVGWAKFARIAIRLPITSKYRKRGETRAQAHRNSRVIETSFCIPRWASARGGLRN